MKNFFKLTLLLLVVMLYNCEKEDAINLEEEIYQEKTLQTISLQDLNTKLGSQESFRAISEYFDVINKSII